MMEFKRQSKISTRMDRTVNMNIFFKEFGFELGVISSEYWGNFKEREEPHITFNLDGKEYQVPIKEFIKKLRMMESKGLKR